MNSKFHGKVPPQSLDVERSVLGSVLTVPNIMDNLNRAINIDWFYSTANKKIMTCIMQLNNNQEAIDLITVNSQLLRNEWLEDVGGPSYLSELVEDVSTSQNLVSYIKILERKYKLRQLIEIGTTITTEAFNPDADIENVLHEAENKLFGLTGVEESKEAVHVSEFIAPVFEEIEQRKKNKCISGIATGFAELNKYTGGWQDGNLILLAARPGMGKTSLALKLLVEAGVPVGMFSLEMTSKELTQRLIATGAQVSLFRLRNGHTNTSELNRLGVSAGDINASKIYLNDCSSLNISTLYSQIRKLVRKYGLKMLVVDYIQLMGSVDKKLNKIDRVSEISWGLKLIAKEFSIPVIALSQLNRGLENRPDKRPKLSDLRDSGTLEQDADLVLFVYREYIYTKKTEDEPNAEIIVEKQRNGATGIVNCGWEPTYTTFIDRPKEGF